ncbi:putative glutathione-S-transferase theta, GST [Talaromyces proteolyticus]|uniref:Glutathione-S-transferase theta, GST n=1 Tax=Talaromyces proteolyticus TaxID=1131652 RepID=A0AAD4KS38_9EURO|nr:putative glutathione-S-transferase theta, GST [Talaromyces proteolyticus]KAH8697916.1 putative glutathione-S-transferase theta, GST [Talaromyces proteolyticus]
MSVISETRGCIDFYTTPGYSPGAQIAIILGELGLAYRFHEIKPTVKKEDTPIHHEPNAVLKDIDEAGLAVTFEGASAIMHYLIKQYDSDHKISFPPNSPEAEQVSTWQPFFKSPTKNPSHSPATKEPGTKGSNTFEILFSLNERLRETEDYLVGHKFSVADIAHIPVVVTAEDAGVDIEMFPNVVSWYNNILSRSGVEKGLAASSSRSF